LALLVLAALPGCDPAALITKQGPQRGGHVTEAIVGEAATINPLFAVEDNARDIDSLVYQGLTMVDANQDTVPVLASSINVSSDGLTYTLRIRAGVKWADGAPFTTDDVLFTYHALQDPAYTDPAGQFWKQVRVELAGLGEVRFVLKAPDASFPAALRQGIVPQHVFAGMPFGQMANDPHSFDRAFGTGPFLVDSVSASKKVVTLRRNVNARPQANLDQVLFHSYPTLADAADAVSRGEADAFGALQPPQLADLSGQAGLTVHELKTFSFAAALFNLSPELSVYFQPPAVRTAMVQAIDRNQLVQAVLAGHADAAPGPIPPTDWAFDRESAGKYPYDPVAARRALDAAGWLVPQGGTVRQRGGRDFSISLVTADAYPYRQVADSLSQQLAKVGIQVTVDAVPASVLVSRYLVGKHFQMALVAFDNGPDPDQFGLWHSTTTQDPLNFASALVPKQALIDKDLEDGRSAVDRKSRKLAYSDFQDLMSDAAPAIFLYEPHYAYVVSSRIHGVRTDPVVEPTDRFQYVTEWWVDVKQS
jgi:peptide/nickel transport system substrate-binding protein